jgi:hypothetical protein
MQYARRFIKLLGLCIKGGYRLPIYPRRRSLLNFCLPFGCPNSHFRHIASTPALVIPSPFDAVLSRPCGCFLDYVPSVSIVPFLTARSALRQESVSFGPSLNFFLVGSIMSRNSFAGALDAVIVPEILQPNMAVFTRLVARVCRVMRRRSASHQPPNYQVP